MSKLLRIATRKSPLALQQTQIFAQKLLKVKPELSIELVAMTTQGDQLLDKTLQYWGGKGLFVKELERALLDHEADIAVHSMKDVPATLPEHLELACICERDNPFDALVSPLQQNLDELKSEAIIGTASLRRQAQLLAYRPDLKVKILRGNIHTRLEKLNLGQYDAIILACAGLERMNLNHFIHQQMNTQIMLPACGQGAIGIECRSDDTETKQILQTLHHDKTALCVQLEREVNARLGGHCHVPIAIFAEFVDEQHLQLDARVFSANGKKYVRFSESCHLNNIENLAKRCAQYLIHHGALQLIQANDQI